MSAISLAALCASMALTGLPGNGAAAKARVKSAMKYAATQVIAKGDSDATIAEKAAKVLPRANQIAWMDLEQTYFIHFGPNTFRGVEWGNGRESPGIFNPTALDADQWVRTVKAAGGKMVILVAKHHDGMSLWPTRYSDHSVASSPWRDGKGNLVREVSDAARKHGVKLGIYLSPADLWQLRTNPVNPSGYYGNGSAKLTSHIPTDPTTFTSDPSKGRAATPGFTSYTYAVDDYNRYLLNQLYELLTEYGRVDEVWFDGANPDPSVKEAYDYGAWYDLIRKLQPQAIIFGKGPDGRWVGNEQGLGRLTEWSVIPLTAAPDNFTWPDMTDQDLGSRARLTPGSHLWWYPAEVNTSILRGWFWAHRKGVKSGAELVDLYYHSVGRNGNMLLNLAPDTRGLIPDDQIASLDIMARVNGQTFARNLAEGARLSADSSAPAHPAAMAVDRDAKTWWEAASGRQTATLTLTLGKSATFDVVSLQEAVDRRGQRVERFAVDIWHDGAWKEVDRQTTIGHKRLLRWDTPVTSDRVRIRIVQSRLAPSIASIALYKQADIVGPPDISRRASDGTVTLNCTGNRRVAYTLNGAMPSQGSTIYTAPVAIPSGGDLAATCLDDDGRPGMATTRRFPGFVQSGWTIVSADPTGALAIDDNEATFWQTTDGARDRTLTVDMQTPRDIAGVYYLPRQDSVRDGIVETFRLETSLNGTNWQTVIDNGRFDNIRNNPILQDIRFAPLKARYFRFTALTVLGDGVNASAAEIGVMSALNAAQ